MKTLKVLFIFVLMIYAGCTSIVARKYPITDLQVAIKESKSAQIRVVNTSENLPASDITELLRDEVQKSHVFSKVEIVTFPEKMALPEQSNSADDKNYFDEVSKLLPIEAGSEDFTLDVIIRFKGSRTRWSRVPLNILTLFIIPLQREYQYSARIHLMDNKTKAMRTLDLSEKFVVDTSTLPFFSSPKFINKAEPIVNLVKVALRKLVHEEKSKN